MGTEKEMVQIMLNRWYAYEPDSISVSERLKIAKENSVPCCRICNYAKSNMDVNDFKEWEIKICQKDMADQWGTFIRSKNVAACL